VCLCTPANSWFEMCRRRPRASAMASPASAPRWCGWGDRPSKSLRLFENNDFMSVPLDRPCRSSLPTKVRTDLKLLCPAPSAPEHVSPGTQPTRCGNPHTRASRHTRLCRGRSAWRSWTGHVRTSARGWSARETRPGLLEARLAMSRWSTVHGQLTRPSFRASTFRGHCSPRRAAASGTPRQSGRWRGATWHPHAGSVRPPR
jgi:hypothetical protein